MKITVKLENGKLFFEIYGTLHARDLDSGDLATLQGFSDRYAELGPPPKNSHVNNQRISLSLLGREVFGFFDRENFLSENLRQTYGNFELEISVPPCPSEEQRILFNLPWEILATEQGFLGEDSKLHFCPLRTVEVLKPMRKPASENFTSLFQCASAKTHKLYDFQTRQMEMRKIAWENRDFSLKVEDTGTMRGLERELTVWDRGFDLLNLICETEKTEKESRLFFNDGSGGMKGVPFADLSRIITDGNTPKCLLLNLFSRETPWKIDALPFFELNRAGLCCVIAVCHPSGEVEPGLFTRFFHARLAKRVNVKRAFVQARMDLIGAKQSVFGDGSLFWHVPRLFLTVKGDGKLCRPPKKSSCHSIDKALPLLAFENKNVFRRNVNERLELMTGKNHRPISVMLGLKGSGKTSAVKLFREKRLPAKTIVLEAPFTFLELLRRILMAFAEKPHPGPMHEELKRVFNESKHRPEKCLEGLLAKIGHNSFPDLSPVLIIDAFENFLKASPSKDSLPIPLKKHHAMLDALFRIFFKHTGKARLILSSRLDFSLPNRTGKDLAEKLPRFELGFAQPRELEFMAFESMGEQESPKVFEPLLNKAVKHSCGHPAIFFQSIENIKDFRKTTTKAGKESVARPEDSDTPDETDPHEYFKSFPLVPKPSLRDVSMLRFIAQLPFPISPNRLIKAARAGGLQEVENALRNLRAKSWIHRYETNGYPRIAPNPLVSRQVLCDKTPMPSEWRTPKVCAILLKDIEEFPNFGDITLSHAFSAFDLAIRCRNFGTASAILESSGRKLLDVNETKDCAYAFEQLADLCVSLQKRLSSKLCRLFLETSEKKGTYFLDIEKMIFHFPEKVENLQDAKFLVRWASHLQLAGEKQRALDVLLSAKNFFSSADQSAEEARVAGRMADYLQQNGSWEQALKMRLEKEIPLLEKLGNVWEKAVAQGQVADILQDRGRFENSRRLRIREELPVYGWATDPRHTAVTLVKIADTLIQEGNWDAALQMLHGDCRQVFEKTGDKLNQAKVFGKIADILFLQGKLDESLYLRETKELPVMEKLADKRERAITLVKIAQILYRKGKHREALDLCQSHCLKTLKKAGDLHGTANALFLMAQAKIKLKKDSGLEIDEGETQMLEEARKLFGQLGAERESSEAENLLKNSANHKDEKPNNNLA